MASRDFFATCGVLLTIAAPLALSGCNGPPIQGLAVERYCAHTTLWVDPAGNHYVGVINAGKLLDPVAKSADLNAVCEAWK